jgi:hypothetical protein
LSGWQGIRNQLFGQQRERDAEDGLLRVITQLQTSLAQATGLNEGPLTNPAARTQALRAVQDGLNGLIDWHKEQLRGAQSIGGWSGPVPELARDVLAAVQTLRPLFEGAEHRSGALDCRDVIQSVAQLRGRESDSYFNEALDGLVAMLEAVYVRIGIDAPTAGVAVSLGDLWDILLDELRALRCEDPVNVEPVLEVLEAPIGLSELSEESVVDVDAEEQPMLRCAQDEDGSNVIELARFRRLVLVAC